MEIFIKIVQLLLSLSILVVLHEFGHFSFAKLFKTRVEKVYLFSNPWFQIFKKKIGETEYGIGWLPLGGYVKIAGMIDESMDKEQMKKPPQPYEFRSKRPWQRFFIMISGVLMNFILAGIIYIGILYTWGDDYIPTESVNKYGISVDSAAYKIGFRNGDKLLSVNNQTFERFSALKKEMVLNSNKTVQVLRNGKKKDFFIDDKFALKASKQDFIQPRFEFVIANFAKHSNAENAGLKKGDKLIGVNDSSLQFFDQYVHYFTTHKKSLANLKIDRKGSIITLPVQVDSSGMIGISAKTFAGIEFKHVDYTFFTSIPAGITKGIELTKDYLRSFKLIFNSETKAYKQVGSFFTIGNMFPGVWDWQSFWTMTAFLSIILGVVNLLPIPALDGGHVVFVLYEMITRRKPGDKFMEYAQITGFVILMAIIFLALKNDFVNFHLWDKFISLF